MSKFTPEMRATLKAQADYFHHSDYSKAINALLESHDAYKTLWELANVIPNNDRLTA